MITAQVTGRSGRHRARSTRPPGPLIRPRPAPKPAWVRVVTGYWPVLAEPVLTLLALAALLAAMAAE